MERGKLQVFFNNIIEREEIARFVFNPFDEDAKNVLNKEAVSLFLKGCNSFDVNNEQTNVSVS